MSATQRGPAGLGSYVVSVLFIRAHKRYGVCRGVKLHCPADCIAEGLLIEISQEGCRISNVLSTALAIGESIIVEVPDGPNLPAQVRWQHDGIVGLRLTPPLHNASLADLVNCCRDDPQATCLKRA